MKRVKPISEFIRSVMSDNDLFRDLYLEAMNKQVKEGKSVTDFGTGFLLGLWLAQIYCEEKCEVEHDKHNCSKSGTC